MTKSAAKDELDALLNGYLAVLARSRESETRAGLGRSRAIKTLLSGYIQRRNRWMYRQKRSADNFNILEVIGVANDELRHSRMLVWLLDSRIEYAGTHAQGSLGFRLFLEELGLPSSYADAPYWVRLEVVGEESRVDIEVASRGYFIIHIENKFRAAEGERQTHREGNDLRRRATALGVRRAHDDMHGIFLSLDGGTAMNPDFRSLSWSQIAHVLERFAIVARPREVKLFAAHYGRVLRKFTATEPEPIAAKYE